MRTAVALVGAVAVFASGVAVGSFGRSLTGPLDPGGDDPPVALLPDRLDLAGALTGFDACAHGSAADAGSTGHHRGPPAA